MTTGATARRKKVLRWHSAQASIPVTPQATEGEPKGETSWVSGATTFPPIWYSYPLDLVAGQVAYGVPTASPDVATRMQADIEDLKARVAALEEAVKPSTTSTSISHQVAEWRTISKEQATEEVRKLFASGETLYMSEVAERLHLPDWQVVEICLELQKEGELQAHDDILQSG